MAKTNISQKLANALNNASLLKRAGLEEVSTDSAGKEEHGADAKALQDGTMSGVVDANVTAGGETQPGGASNIMNSSPTEATASTIAPTTNNEEEESAAKKLDASKGEVVADDLKEIEKQASIVIGAANEIVNFLTSEAFQKQASAQMEIDMNATQNTALALNMLEKLASAGDPAAQQILDYRASFFAGMQKKANDVEALVGEDASPEEVAAAEDALNEAAMEDPSAIMEDGEEGEEGDEEDADAKAVGAQAEQEAQDLVLEYADAIMEANPDVQPEEALQMAQEEVADAVATVVLQQQAGDVDENGEPEMSDEELAEATDEMVKSASAHPDRDALCDHINQRIGLDPSAFAQRLGF